VTGPLRRTAKSALAVTGRWRPAGNGVLVTFHRRGEFDPLLAGAGLEPVAGATIGFGPFTLLGRRLLSDPVSVRVDASLQKLADRDVPGLRSTGTQYLVIAHKPTGAGAG
jgi:hypothetical protein